MLFRKFWLVVWSGYFCILHRVRYFRVCFVFLVWLICYIYEGVFWRPWVSERLGKEGWILCKDWNHILYFQKDITQQSYHFLKHEIVVYCLNTTIFSASNSLCYLLPTQKKKHMIYKTLTLTNYTLAKIYPKMQKHIGREEPTLDRTHPLRHTYTPSSIKVLFSKNQVKSSFRKCIATTIKIYIPQYSKNMIYKPLQPHFDWGRMISSHERFILCSYPHQNFKARNK